MGSILESKTNLTILVLWCRLLKIMPNSRAVDIKAGNEFSSVVDRFYYLPDKMTVSLINILVNNLIKKIAYCFISIEKIAELIKIIVYSGKDGFPYYVLKINKINSYEVCD